MSDPKELLQDILKKNKGIALGEDHKSQEIFSFVRDNAVDLKKAGVKTLYLEAIESQDTAAVQKMLKDGDDKELREYLKTRSWSEDLANQYFDVIKDYHKQGIEIVGIDIKTNERFKIGNPHWESVIQEHQKKAEGKYIILGGASHFGNTFGPGVNITLKIPSVDFSVSNDPKTKADAKPSEEKFQGRSVADYEITLPKKQDDAAPKKAPMKKVDGLKPEDIDLLRQSSDAAPPNGPLGGPSTSGKHIR